MGKARALFVLFTISTAWVAYYFATPVPVGFDEPMKIRIFQGIMGITADVAIIGEKLGITNWVNITRLIPKLLGPPKGTSDDKILLSDEVFDGVPVRVYRPRGAASTSLPALVYYHGGGWVLGDVDMYNTFARMLIPDTSIVLISVDYRLAPEHPYPAPLDDCHKATIYALEHASKLGIDASKVMVGGDSAGGNLAVAVTHRMKTLNPPLLAQILLYPALQSLNFQLPSYQQTWTPMLTAPMMPAFYQYYFTGAANASVTEAMLKGTHVTDRIRERYSQFVDYRKLPESFRKDYVAPDVTTVDTDAAQKLEHFVLNTEINPLLNPNLAGLPSALVMTCEYDVLRNDGTLYAIRLNEAGVEVQHIDYKQGFHGMGVLIEDPLKFQSGLKLISDITQFIRSKSANE